MSNMADGGINYGMIILGRRRNGRCHGLCIPHSWVEEDVMTGWYDVCLISRDFEMYSLVQGMQCVFAEGKQQVNDYWLAWADLQRDMWSDSERSSSNSDDFIDVAEPDEAFLEASSRSASNTVPSELTEQQQQMGEVSVTILIDASMSKLLHAKRQWFACLIYNGANILEMRRFNLRSLCVLILNAVVSTIDILQRSAHNKGVVAYNSHPYFLFPFKIIEHFASNLFFFIELLHSFLIAVVCFISCLSSSGIKWISTDRAHSSMMADAWLTCRHHWMRNNTRNCGHVELRIHCFPFHCFLSTHIQSLSGEISTSRLLFINSFLTLISEKPSQVA